MDPSSSRIGIRFVFSTDSDAEGSNNKSHLFLYFLDRLIPKKSPLLPQPSR